jgi:hypothetical protein
MIHNSLLIGEAGMDDLFLLSERQVAMISPFFPLAHGRGDVKIWTRQHLGLARLEPALGLRAAKPSRIATKA